MEQYKKLAEQILLKVGGKENVSKVNHCATRLRFFLKDESKASKIDVENLDGIVTVVLSAGQFQIVIGQHVAKVYNEIMELMGENPVADQNEGKKSVLNKIISTMSAVFAPFIYILAASGILQGVLILINLAYPAFADTGTYEILSMTSWAPFVFLPIFIAVTASKHFKANTYIAIAVCAALVSPTLSSMVARIQAGESITLFFMNLSPTVYTATVLPALFLVWWLSYLEKFLDRIFHAVVRGLFTPFFSIVITVPLTLLIIGPITATGANMVANGYNFLVAAARPVAAIVIGGFWQVFVLFGVHWGITPVVLANFDLYGRDSFQAYQTIAVIAQVGAALGVALKTRDKKLKGVGISAFVTGLFGITEPAIYGTNLRFKKPFIVACVSGAIGALVASFFSPYYFIYAGLPGPLTLVNAFNKEFPLSLIGELIGAAIAFSLPIAVVFLSGYGKDSTTDADNKDFINKDIQNKINSKIEKLAKEEKIVSIAKPIKGKTIKMTEVNDEAFSSETMGKGAAIVPEEGKVYAPFNGEVVFLADTLHAISMLLDNGVDVLIHFGLDTVTLNGKGFKAFVKEGDKIKQGDLLLEADLDYIRSQNLDITTPILINNSDDYKEVEITEDIHRFLVLKK
ncbi:beta-glucoside-specific PTS transporter subunit IIABC [Treponema phagedenis]|uniref:beta-glucoside-specific PTS transporter subunit IIABC n=1 Tax=Treponema phagedenis TaxID=162 RepID=UPI0011E75DAA|nr:beta-glucoside-specific PTS transporter subunit IIABC [Treponema phagedenis]NVP23303.1 PTS glucose transporter subunit IIA [Treponema phagedenis]QEJ94915.1 PTS beta-glucoside transporter subunit EIIBCA [Treponema phagedenis]QEK05822.1 PTS beta-glucoside transporter subunit EIIBCA [Treponema phagedenis]QKS92193.1 PTS glucose transporter subunit IIA [Treponema phagedenis]QLC58157.1 PTS glucose transporter subunit IIA [Treponema phagedenis]